MTIPSEISNKQDGEVQRSSSAGLPAYAQDERVKAIRERRAKITPPPWGPHEMTPLCDGLHEWIEIGPYPNAPVAEITNDYGANFRDNAEFIAKAPDDIDYLLSLVDRSQPEASTPAECPKLQGNGETNA